MARERERRGRAAEREAEARQTRLIFIGVGAVLAVAALLIFAGLYVTQYQPPRAHVLSIAGRDYQARDVVRLGTYFFLDSRTSIADSARASVDIIVEEEALRRVAPDTVAQVSADDVELQTQIDFGLIADPRIGDPGPVDGSATPEPTVTAEPTAEPTVDAQEFADALTAFLRNTGLVRADYEEMVEARLYRERLRDQFTDELGTSGPQIRLQRIRVSTQLAADTVLEELEGGADFATLADEQSVATEDGEGGEVGWTVSDLETDDVHAVIDGLGVGAWSDSIAAGLFFEIYLLAEVAEDREYDDGIVSALVDADFADWLEAAIDSLEVEEDLSSDEELWINDHVLSEVTSRLGG